MVVFSVIIVDGVNVGKTTKKTINDCINLAKKRKGICISKVYINSKAKMLWKCKREHIWKATYSTINSLITPLTPGTKLCQECQIKYRGCKILGGIKKWKMYINKIQKCQ